ncbi:MAG TPA: LysM domain-containing protein [Pyrinomonadaceae bacterium]|nr:LysM domain-containing protein [Pyrinomonadaceae bacterium]
MTYTVRPGDTMSKIAMRNGVSVAQLLQANPQITNPNRINVGDVLNLPNSSTTTDNTQPLPSTVAKAAAAVGALGAAIAEALGQLSAKYETGGRGPGTVSTGAGDPGGVSYGSYQMATKMGTVAKFVSQPNFPWRNDFQNLTPGTAQFTAVWKRIAQEQTAAFQEAQHAYIKKTHYDLLAAKILAEAGLDVNTRSHALMDAVWSTAVQHGGASPIVCRACSSVSCDRSDPKYDELLIKAIYAERGKKKPDGNLAYFSKSSPSVQQGVANRFRNECQDALAMLSKEA